MSRRDADVILRQMLDFARKAAAMAEGRTQDNLDHDLMLNLALTRLVEIIGEAANRLTKDQQSRWPSVDWGKIVGMRNRLIHGYDFVDPKILWQVVTEDLPNLIAELENILSGM